MIAWTTTLDDAVLIRKIANRASRLTGVDRQTLAMSITACHANGCPLRLADLLAADNLHFVHDVLGIVKHIDRDTGALPESFHPRFAAVPTPEP
jgi:hypothetical protein